MRISGGRNSIQLGRTIQSTAKGSRVAFNGLLCIKFVISWKVKPFIVLQTLSKIWHYLNREIFFLTVLFQDYEAANKIMETTKPVPQRHYARELKDFDLKLWNLKCADIIKQGNFHKAWNIILFPNTTMLGHCLASIRSLI